MNSGLIIAWGEYVGKGAHDYAWQICAIVSMNSGGSVITACNGRWSVNEPHRIFPLDSAPHGNRCELCEARWVDQKFVERGLRELVDNTYSNIGREVKRFAAELKRHNPGDLAGLEWWLGPCAHGASPRTRCTWGCAPKELGT